MSIHRLPTLVAALAVIALGVACKNGAAEGDTCGTDVDETGVDSGKVYLLQTVLKLAEHKPTIGTVDGKGEDSPAPPDTKGFGKPAMWLYWDLSSTGNASELPIAAIRLSVSTVFAQNSRDFDVHLVGKKSVHKFLNRYKLPSYFDRLPTNIQGDLASIALLAEHGGVYLDTDVLVFRSLLPLFEETVKLDGPEFISMSDRREKQPVFVHGFMGARPNSPLLENLFNACMDFIRLRGKCTSDGCETYSNFGWADMIYGVGYKILADYMARHGDTAFKVVGWNEQYTLQPWQDAALDMFATAPEYKHVPPDHAYLVHWMHNAVKSEVDQLTEAELLGRNCMFSSLVHKALGV